MLTQLSALAFPLALRGLLRRESRRDPSVGFAAPPRGSAPPTPDRNPSDPPPQPEPAPDAMAWSAGVEPCTHARLVVASIYSGRIG